MKWHTTELNGKNKPNNLNSCFNTGALFYFLNWSPQLMRWCTWENMRIEGHISMRSEAAVVITRWSGTPEQCGDTGAVWRHWGDVGTPGRCGDTRDMWQHLSSLLGSGYAAAAVPHNRHQYSFKRSFAKISQSRRRPLLALATGSFTLCTTGHTFEMLLKHCCTGNQAVCPYDFCIGVPISWLLNCV